MSFILFHTFHTSHPSGGSKSRRRTWSGAHIPHFVTHFHTHPTLSLPRWEREWEEDLERRPSEVKNSGSGVEVWGSCCWDQVWRFGGVRGPLGSNVLRCGGASDDLMGLVPLSSRHQTLSFSLFYSCSLPCACSSPSSGPLPSPVFPSSCPPPPSPPATGHQTTMMFRQTQKYFEPLYDRLKHRALHVELRAGLWMMVGMGGGKGRAGTGGGNNH